jgi:hypothetical protein
VECNREFLALFVDREDMRGKKEVQK